MRIPVSGLLGRPGQRRSLVTSVPPDAFGDDPWGPSVERLDGEVALDLLLEAVAGGVIVRGSVVASPVTICARCLALTPTEVRVELTELHRAVRTGGRVGEVDEDVDGGEEDLDYELVEGDTQLELDRMVRDALVVGQPVRVLCRPDCLGLCPSCGADLNLGPCGHGRDEPVDPRWEALRRLQLPPQGSGPDDGEGQG